MVIGKYTDVFRLFFFCFFFGRGEEVEGVMWKYLSMEKIVMGEENFNEGSAGFSSII